MRTEINPTLSCSKFACYHYRNKSYAMLQALKGRDQSNAGCSLRFKVRSCIKP
jgi:hypothetical protein